MIIAAGSWTHERHRRGAGRRAPPLTAMSGARRERALARWRVLRPHVQDGIALTRVAGDCGIPLRAVPSG